MNDFEKAKEAYDKAQVEYLEASHKFLSATLHDASDFALFEKHMKPYTDTCKETYIKMLELAKDFNLKELPKYGDYMTFEVFKRECLEGCLIDYDGSGNFCIGDKMTEYEVSPSMITENYKHPIFDGVIWFNK